MNDDFNLNELFLRRQVKHSRNVRTGVETDELVAHGAANPIVNAAVLFAEIGAALEKHGVARLAAFHLDLVFIRPAALAFERRPPDAVFGGDLAIEPFACFF